MKPGSLPLLLALLGAALPAAAQDIVRHKIPGSDFPIAQAVTLPPNATIHFISGQVPPVVDKSAPGDSLAAFGNTKQQTVGVLNKIKEILAGMGLGMGDVVKMQVFLVGGDQCFSVFLSASQCLLARRPLPALAACSAVRRAATSASGTGGAALPQLERA